LRPDTLGLSLAEARTILAGLEQAMAEQQTAEQIRWSEWGAHLLLQIPAQVLNGDWRATFSRWYPAMKVAPESKAA